jgi:hypothetical protein
MPLPCEKCPYQSDPESCRLVRKRLPDLPPTYSAWFTLCEVCPTGTRRAQEDALARVPEGYTICQWVHCESKVLVPKVYCSKHIGKAMRRNNQLKFATYDLK